MTTVVMTGGTAGLGQVTAHRISSVPDTRLLLGSRTPGSTTTSPLDLSRLASVREFARAVQETLGATPVDVLVLNAGVQLATNRTRTEDGFETTFAVNHLAHHLLLRLLLPALADDATVVITTSDTHDPRTNPLGAPRDLDPGSLAHPPAHGGFGAGFRAYAASKLCNLLTARALAAARPRLRVIAYNPGFTPGTHSNATGRCGHARPSPSGRPCAPSRASPPSSRRATRSWTSPSAGSARRPGGSTPRWSRAASPGRTRRRSLNATT